MLFGIPVNNDGFRFKTSPVSRQSDYVTSSGLKMNWVKRFAKLRVDIFKVVIYKGYL
jgi:hypothetical protein